MRYHYIWVALFAVFLCFWATEPLMAQKDIKIQGTYQIEKDQRQGWLILNIQIPKGYHIYALTQVGNPPPTKIQLAKSQDFELLDKFKADKKPKVIENDPIFEQRIEKHEGKIALLAPIKVAKTADLKDVVFDLHITGQLCSDTGCRPFNNKKIEVEFAGFYDGKEKKKKNNE